MDAFGLDSAGGGIGRDFKNGRPRGFELAFSLLDPMGAGDVITMLSGISRDAFDVDFHLFSRRILHQLDQVPGFDEAGRFIHGAGLGGDHFVAAEQDCFLVEGGDAAQVHVLLESLHFPRGGGLGNSPAAGRQGAGPGRGVAGKKQAGERANGAEPE